MTLEALLTLASATLERQGARLVHFSDDDVTVESGMGLRKRRLDVPLAPLLEWLGEHPQRERAGISSFFRGVGAVVLEPRMNRRQAGMDFAEAAGKVMPSLEGPLFDVGAQRALGESEPIFGQRTFSDLFVACYLELDTGRRLVTRSDVAHWDVSDERLDKAALSMLFHRSYDIAPEPYPLEGVPGCRVFSLGDSYDATRSLILESLLYQQALRGLLVAMPSPDRCLLAPLPEPGDTAVLDAFAAHVEALFEQNAWPLSRRLYRVALGPPEELRR